MEALDILVSKLTSIANIEHLQYFLELTPKKRCPFHHRAWNIKRRNQEITGVTGKFGLGVQNEAGQRLTVLSREHVGYSKYHLPTTQEATLHMDITKWEKLYTVSKNKTWSSLAQIISCFL